MKYKIRKTGEIIDVVSYSGLTSTERDEIDDWVDYIDSKGNEIKHAQLNLYWDLEPIQIESVIDWEQKRCDMAKDFTATLLGRLNYDPFTANVCCYCCSDGEPVNPYIHIAEIAVKATDALIDEFEENQPNEE